MSNPTKLYSSSQPLPVVEAVPLGAQQQRPSPASNSKGNNTSLDPSSVLVSLPTKCSYQDLGVQIEGSPPRISFITETSPVVKQCKVGQYCHGIYFPDVEVVNLSDTTHLTSLINANVNNQRQLLLSMNQYYYDECMDSPQTTSSQQQQQSIGPLYRVLLPPNGGAHELGIQLSGFPPVIQNVDEKSALFGKVHPYQTVQAFFVPGQALFHLGSGAFTSQKLWDRLQETAAIPGRRLVLKDTRNKVYKGESTWWDLGGPNTNTGRWTLGRMLGIGKNKNNK